MTDEFCKAHSGIIERISDARKLFMWSLGIIMGLVVGVAGFLWSVQSTGFSKLWTNHEEVRKKLEIYQESLTGRDPGKEGVLTRMEKNLDKLTWQMEQDERVKAASKAMDLRKK